MRTCIPSLLFPLLSAFAQTAPPGVDEILAKHLAASGGAAAIGRLTSEMRKGAVQLGPNTTFPMEILAKADGKWQFSMIMPRIVRFSHVSDGRTGWFLDPDNSTKMPPANWLEESVAFDFQAPFRLRRYFPEMKVKGKETVDGRDVWAIEAKPADGPAVPVHFDAQTGLLRSIGTTFFDDYRETDRVVLPFTKRSVEGRRVEVFRTTEIRHNVPVDDALFAFETSVAMHKRGLKEMTRESLATALKGIDPGSAGPMLAELHGFAAQDGRFLYDLIASRGYKRALEIGTAHGNSGLWMGVALRKNGGKLITLEMDKERALAATENFRKAGLQDVIECRNNDAFKEIPELKGEFDFVFMDTGTRLHKRFLDLVYSRVKPGGAIVSHNANEFERSMPDFLNAITKDPSLETKITRTPGGGFSVSIKKS